MSKQVLLMNPYKKTSSNPPGKIEPKEVAAAGAALIISGVASQFASDMVAKQVVMRNFADLTTGQPSQSPQPDRSKALMLFGSKAVTNVAVGGSVWYLSRVLVKKYAPEYSTVVSYSTMASIGANLISDSVDLFKNLNRTEQEIAAEQFSRLNIKSSDVVALKQGTTNDYLQLNDLMPSAGATGNLNLSTDMPQLATDYLTTDEIANEDLTTDDYLESDSGDGTQDFIEYDPNDSTNDYIEY